MNELRDEKLHYTSRIEIGNRLARDRAAGDIMGRTEAARANYSEQIEEAHVDAQIAVLQSDVAHIKTDLSEMKVDIRELRGDMKVANEAIAGLRTEMAEQRAELKDDIAGLRTELKGDIAGLRTETKSEFGDVRASIEKVRAEMNVGFEKLRGSQRIAVAANTIGQLLTAGTILGIVGKALEWF